MDPSRPTWPPAERIAATLTLRATSGSRSTSLDLSAVLRIRELGLQTFSLPVRFFTSASLTRRDPFTDSSIWLGTIDNISWTVTIPPKLKSGAYLIRHEILALHSARAPQFYPHCSQLVVTGSGTATPSSSELVAIPGIYKNDQSTMINIWNNGQTKYTIAGPPVTKIGAYTTTNSKNKLGGGTGPIPFKAGKILSGNAVTAAIGSTGDSVATGNNAGANTTTTKAATTTKATTTKAAVAAASTTPVKSCKVSTKKRDAAKANKRHAKKRLSTNH